jgi:Ca-activated chloride channel family protein
MKSKMNKHLEVVRIEATLNDLFCEMEVNQTFNNSGKTNIEAVYTFPLPHDAVLLDLFVKIGERELRGAVLPKAKASQQYEQTISDGHGAIMLEKADDGIYTVNVGNLLPGESAKLTYRYGYLLDWQHGTVKFRIPTTIAPRYGDPIAAGFQPHQIPATDILAENRYSLKIIVTGLLAGAEAECPSHKIAVQRETTQMEIGFQSEKVFMDRDFVLNFKLKDAEFTAGTVAPDSISNGSIALASFCPQIPGGDIPTACIKILVDCSGSMGGDSITQAKNGLLRVLENLRESDTFNVIRFGDSTKAYFPSCVLAKGRNLQNAILEVEKLDADLGGTEMGTALEYVYGVEDEGGRPAMILLITDGEVSAHKEITRRAMRSAHRIFTVGVGSAVNEEFVRSIAEKTGGACELVSPNEGMADAIYRQFRRMLQPQITSARVEWPSEPQWKSPSDMGIVFSGDTKHVFASFAVPPEGNASLVLEMADGEMMTQKISLISKESVGESLQRMAASSRIKGVEAEHPELAEKLALNYQLVTKQTNYLVLELRDEDRIAEDLPELAKVNQMLAAGWGGTGSVRADVSGIDYSELDMPGGFRSGRRSQLRFYSSMDALDIQSFLRKQVNDSVPSRGLKASTKEKLTGLMDPRIRKSPPSPDYSRLVASVLSVGDRWFDDFKRDLLPVLPTQMRRQIEKLYRFEGWSESQVYAAALTGMAKKLGIKTENMLVSKLIADFGVEGLVRFFTDGVTVNKMDWDLVWESSYELAPAF